MNIASTIARIAAVLAAASALTALAGVAQAGTSRPPSMSNAEPTASRLRSEALNERYGLGSQNEVRRVTAADRASRLRSEALNARYGLGEQRAAAVPSQSASSTRAYAWGAFGTGAAAMFGLALLAGGFVARRRLLATLRGLAPRYRTT